MINIPEYDQLIEYDRYNDFHAVHTIMLGELIHDGLIDFKDGSWDAQPNGLKIDWFNEETKDRIWAKFGQYYYWREIGELPFKRWKSDVLAKMSLLIPKYNLLYDIMSRKVDPMQEYDEYGKSRNIYSDFPQTMLSGNEDYASTGNDNQFERVRLGDFVDRIMSIAYDYNDVDYILIREFDSNFYCLLSSNMNGY